jgi:hypothetical protein
MPQEHLKNDPLRVAIDGDFVRIWLLCRNFYNIIISWALLGEIEWLEN